MSAGHSDPQVLYSVDSIRAFHLQNGQESEITTSGPQTMSLLMVPTSSPYSDQPTSAAPEEDFYLHLHIPPELDQPLPATTQVYHKPPSSYLIPRWDLGPDAGAFIRIQFPSLGDGPGRVTQEQVDTFETILAQCTAFLERAQAPADYRPYDPSTYRPGEGYVSSEHEPIAPKHGQIVLIDEENGSVVGELSGNYDIAEAANVKPGSKNPVEIQLPAEGQGNRIQISNASEEFLAMSRHPAYVNSTVVQTSARASRLIVAGSSYLSNAMIKRADTFQSTTEPNPKPMTFSPATQNRIRQIHSFTAQAVGLSAKTVGQVTRYAQNAGARFAGRGEKTKKGYDKSGQPDASYKPGFLNKSMIAFSTIADGIDHAGRTLLASGSTAATNVVSHKYGEEAGNVAASLSGGVKNVGLVYIDVAGVSRRALIKSVAKGMVVGRMPNGQPLVVGAGDGGVMPEDMQHSDVKKNDYYAPAEYGGASQAGDSKSGYGGGGYGAHANQPPAYSPGSGLGEQQYPREKR